MNGSSGSTQRVERAVFETDRYRIVGDLTLPPKGYQSRFSDLLNREGHGFVPLTDVEVVPLDGGEARRHRFLALGKEHIRLAHPLEEAGE
jgi:hypothetical protein